jgi:hypothetical protein
MCFFIIISSKKKTRVFFSLLYLYRYRHEVFDNGFGIEWMDDSNDEPTRTITEESNNDQDLINNHNHTNSKHSRSIITVRSVYNNATRLPAHIWRSLAKVWITYLRL